MPGLFILMAALIQAPDPTIALLTADRELSASSAREGLEAALPPALAGSPVLLLPGAPVLRGRDAIVGALAAAEAERELVVEWTARASWVSLDGALGVTAGVLSAKPKGEGQQRSGTYVACWKLVDGAWKLAALMQAGLAPGNRPLYDPAWGPKALTALAPSGAARSIIASDIAFSARAGTDGAGAAFEAYAAPDAVVFSPGGASRGPREIGASIGQGPPADWSWVPVVAELAESGDLGYTIGQAVIAPQSGGGPVLSKYLTVWKRQPDGTMRFLTDGGNGRPAP
ncbi:MAG: nuclear transport factor 2 family protein [Gemmatimonadales bacterium]